MVASVLPMLPVGYQNWFPSLFSRYLLPFLRSDMFSPSAVFYTLLKLPIAHEHVLYVCCKEILNVQDHHGRDVV